VTGIDGSLHKSNKGENNKNDNKSKNESTKAVMSTLAYNSED
jgi:hypothetical protein